MPFDEIAFDEGEEETVPVATAGDASTSQPRRDSKKYALKTTPGVGSSNPETTEDMGKKCNTSIRRNTSKTSMAAKNKRSREENEPGVDVDYDDDTLKAKSETLGSSPVKRRRLFIPDLSFHTLKDPQFSFYALPTLVDDEREQRESWHSTSRSCRCLQCEVLRVADRINAAKGIILVDLDNVGLDKASNKSDTTARVIPLLREKHSLFVWCFCAPMLENLPDDAAMWVTPCGMRNQAADIVMLQVIVMLHARTVSPKVFLLTNDAILQNDATLSGVEVRPLFGHTEEAWSKAWYALDQDLTSALPA